MLKKIIALFLFFIGYSSISFSQNTTFDPNQESKPEKHETGPTEKSNHKILLIPFDPRLYMSEIDRKIAKESQMDFNEIRNSFRFGLDAFLFMSSRVNYRTVSLLSDTSKTAKDIEYIYKSIGWNYDLVPDTASPAGIQGVLPKKNKKEENPSKIKNGQLMVEADYEKRFMNTVIKDPSLLPYLNKKYQADIFIFINQLDLKNNLSAYDIVTDTYPREAGIHYTIMDKEGKQLDAGIAMTSFPSTLNDPKKIIATHFEALNEQILSTLSIKSTATPAPSPTAVKKGTRY